MNLEEFEEKYSEKLSHDIIQISCDSCGEDRSPLKTRAKQTIKKNGFYFCPSCGQSNRHSLKPMTEEVKKKISQGVKSYYKK
jgi:uncharacterized Zn finger protein